MAGMQFTVSAPELDRLRLRARLASQRAKEEIRTAIENRARQAAINLARATPLGTGEGPLGHARDRWGYQMIGPADARVGNPSPQILFLLKGTKAHGPVTASILRFKIDGHWVYAKRVKGIKPDATLVRQWAIETNATPSPMVGVAARLAALLTGTGL